MIKIKSNRSDSCFVCFSPFQNPGVSEDSYAFSNQLKINSYSQDLLFIKDNSNMWYNKKIKGMEGDSYFETKSELAKLLSPYKKVTLFGASMGGYSSILFSNIDNVCESLAISPQVFIKEGWPRYNQQTMTQKSILDLTDPSNSRFLEKSKVKVVVGSDELFDLYQAYKLFGEKYLEYTTVVPNSYHNVAIYFHKRDIVLRFFDLVISGKFKTGMSPYGKFYKIDAEIFQCLKSAEFFELLESYFCNFYSENFKLAVEDAYQLHIRSSNWVGIHRLYGLALYKNGEYEKAIQYLINAQNSIHIYDVFVELADSCVKLKDYEGAFHYLMIGAKRNYFAVNSYMNKLTSKEHPDYAVLGKKVHEYFNNIER